VLQGEVHHQTSGEGALVADGILKKLNELEKTGGNRKRGFVKYPFRNRNRRPARMEGTSVENSRRDERDVF